MPEIAKDATPPPPPPSVLDKDGKHKQAQSAGTVRFTGTKYATRRRVGRSDWPQGVTADRDYEWNLANGYSLPKSDFTKEQLAVLEADGMFSVK